MKLLKHSATSIAIDILERDVWRRGQFNSHDTEMMEEIFNKFGCNFKEQLKSSKSNYTTQVLIREATKNKAFIIAGGSERGRNAKTFFKLKDAA